MQVKDRTIEAVADEDSFVRILHSILKYTGGEQVEEDWFQDTALFHPTWYLEEIRLVTICDTLSLYADMKEYDELDEHSLTAIPGQYGPWGFTVDGVKGLGEVKHSVQVQVLP